MVSAMFGAAACQSAKGEETAAAPRPVLVGSENVIVAREDQIIAGPIVSGELRPERESVLRAQLGGSMLEVRVTEGQSVKQGTVMGRIEARTLEDARRSVESAVRSAETQLQVAEAEMKRTQQLVTAGALAAREVDLSRNNVTAAEAQLADARSRLVTAGKELDDAIVRAPSSGVVAQRMGNTGEIVWTFADREHPPTAVVDIKALMWWEPAKPICDAWAREFVELQNAAPGVKLKGISNFELLVPP
jgi:multidrug efflux pump subunit AcrA (membrane-fusion protein)